MDPAQTDFWGAAVPAWVGAVGGVISAVVAAIAFVQSIRNRKGLQTLRSAANDGQASVEDEQAGADGQTVFATAVRPKPVRWSVYSRGNKGRWLLQNESDEIATLVSFADVTPDGDHAATLLSSLPMVLAPGATIPFRIDKTLVSPAVTAIRIEWNQEEHGRQSVVLYV